MTVWSMKWGGRRPWAAGLLALGMLLSGCAHQTSSAEKSVSATGGTSASSDSDPQRRAQIRLELAASYLQTGRAKVALDEIAQAIAADPSNADAYHLRGLANMSLGDLPKAEDDLKRAQGMKPSDPDIMHNLGWLYCQKQQYEQADQLFTRALATPGYTGSSRTYLSQGLCYQRAGHIADAEKALMHAYEIDAGNPVVGYNLASIIFARGDAKRAQFYIRRVNNGEYANAESLWLGVKVERALQEFVAMRQLGEQLRDRFPDSKQAQAFERGAFDD